MKGYREPPTPDCQSSFLDYEKSSCSIRVLCSYLGLCSPSRLVLLEIACMETFITN